MNAKIGSLLVGAGFLLGTVGVKALTSPQAKRCYVHGVAGALRVKQGYEEIVEQAKAEMDDIVAEANYLNSKSFSSEESCATHQTDAPEGAAPSQKYAVADDESTKTAASI